MELYLRWLDKYERNPKEERPLGLILCASKSDEQVELLELGKSGIRVAEYMIQIPPRSVLEKKLHEVIKNAKVQFKNNEKRTLCIPKTIYYSFRRFSISYFASGSAR